jgi:Raf kinase inhibitor-like YbhB/YbcL family protein
MRTSICIVTILLSACAWAHAEGKEATVAQMTLTSPSFRNGQPIPAKHTCSGEDVSPALKWEGAPAGTKNFALIADDPDAPGGTWVHWLIYDMNVSELEENTSKIEAVGEWIGSATKKKWFAAQGMNDFGKVGYGGPCPPRGHGVHHYHFRLYALDAELNLAPRVTRKQLEAAMKGHIIAETELVGTFQRE